ncbi:hypothetical protein [Pseudoalteromonas ulvae]|uniref:Uncharacterized protein n=1 Tax=Pseudoalteromonas ulvae TaxID=107327 RepID=A0A2C9ZZT2_PSEDV|nr:hypothetical protein [Pseudoalteromonas ulvae]OUL56269.1 hypothetical protein B1199_19350 [Pseudoalteromonas ulvae]
MSFFFLIPAYWLAGIWLYGASPRQQFIKNQRFYPPRWLALCAIALLSLLTVVLFMYAQYTLPLALVFTLLVWMFFIPAPVFMLNHQPDWALASLFAIGLISAIFYFIGGL